MTFFHRCLEKPSAYLCAWFYTHVALEGTAPQTSIFRTRWTPSRGHGVARANPATVGQRPVCCRDWLHLQNSAIWMGKQTLLTTKWSQRSILNNLLLYIINNTYLIEIDLIKPRENWPWILFLRCRANWKTFIALCINNRKSLFLDKTQGGPQHTTPWRFVLDVHSKIRRQNYAHIYS